MDSLDECLLSHGYLSEKVLSTTDKEKALSNRGKYCINFRKILWQPSSPVAGGGSAAVISDHYSFFAWSSVISSNIAPIPPPPRHVYWARVGCQHSTCGAVPLSSTGSRVPPAWAVHINVVLHTGGHYCGITGDSPAMSNSAIACTVGDAFTEHEVIGKIFVVKNI